LEGLKATPYARHIELATLEGNTTQNIIEAALMRNASDTLGFIWKIAPDGGRLFIKALFVPYDAYNLKAVLRGLARGVKREELRYALIPAGEFDGAALDALVGAKDLNQAASMLAVWASPYATAFSETARQWPLALFEAGMALDKFAFEYALGITQGKTIDSRFTRRIITWMIDAENIMTLFNLCNEPYLSGGSDYFFIPGGERLGKDAFKKLSEAKTPSELLESLAKAVKDKEWSAIMEAAYPEEPELLENALDRALEKMLWRAVVTGQSSIALAASYMRRKAGEIKKLRLITRSKVCNMPQDEAKRYIA
jgi:vacuolar-type H+-ATPase subunit C/Vma6